MILQTTARLLRAPASLMDASERPFEQLLPTLLTLIVVGGALFGLVVGSYRGGVQYLYAALKLPVVLVLPLLVALPACRALYRAAGAVLGFERLVLASLVGVARAAILAAALAPGLWLAYSIEIDYHQAVILMCGTLMACGLVGLVTTARLLPPAGRLGICAHAASLLIVGLVLAQSGWLLRPFLVRPRAEVTFLRPIEADVFSSVAGSWRSSQGRYSGWDAERAPLWERDPNVDAREVQ